MKVTTCLLMLFAFVTLSSNTFAKPVSCNTSNSAVQTGDHSCNIVSTTKCSDGRPAVSTTSSGTPGYSDPPQNTHMVGCSSGAIVVSFGSPKVVTKITHSAAQ